MIMDPFIGREEELAELRRYIKKRSASMIVIKGRRRIGKSRLIAEFCKDFTAYSFSGLAPPPPPETITAQDQRDEYAIKLSSYLNIPGIKADDWSTLFLLLADKVKDGRVVIVFDEIQWMAMDDPKFLGKLKIAWDDHFKKNAELILILCGSSSAWIDNNLLSSTGMVGRRSFQLTLEELPLSDCKCFWSDNNNISPYEKFKVLSITGGIPRYLEEIDITQQADENIRNLCFKKGSILSEEFEEIFTDIFMGRSKTYKDIIRTMVDGPVDFDTICEKINLTKSGLVSGYLADLIKSGFIQRDFLWDIKKKKLSTISRYRLSDNYIRFYLKYIEKHLPEISGNRYKLQSLGHLPGWSGVVGLQFQNMVLNNVDFIHKKLHIRDEDIAMANPYYQTATKKRKGCQIDYLIQTRFNGLYVCEIRFSRNEIKSEIITELREKIDRLVRPKGFSCMPVLIHVNGVSDSVVDSGYFTEIIDFTDIL